MLLQRRRASNALRHDAQRLNPLYGYGYNPAWPSILSVAHDEENGGRVFIITDRPCFLTNPPLGVPLVIAPGLDALEAIEILPIKFRLWMSGPVPAGAAWSWPAAASGIADLVTHLALNAGGGYCADTPGPYAPLPPAVVTSAYAGGTTVALVFDRPVAATGGPPDDAITFNGMTADSAANVNPNTLSFATPGPVSPGDPWVISRQPDWLSDSVLWPASGTL